MLINNNPVQLSEDMLYGKGYHKKCYLHPEYANLCIKKMELMTLIEKLIIGKF